VSELWIWRRDLLDVEAPNFTREGFAMSADEGSLPEDVVCEHGTAMDVHCCNCHSGFLFDVDSCVCSFSEGEQMDTRDGTIYDDRAQAEAAGVPDEDLVTGSRHALEKLQKKLVFSKGSFKSVPVPTNDKP
jgi:hypothetical protein